jgi:hypothetical protein
MAGQDAPSRFSSREDPDGDFDGARPDEAVVAEAWQAWREEIAFADSFVVAAPALELLGKKEDAWRGNEALRGTASFRGGGPFRQSVRRFRGRSSTLRRDGVASCGTSVTVAPVRRSAWRAGP